MYLRHRETVWDSADVPEAPQGRPMNGAWKRPEQLALPARPSTAAVRLPVVELNQVKLHALGEAQVIDHILNELNAGRGGVVVTPNLDHLRRYCRDLSFGALIAEADLVVADGMPLVWASRLQGTPLPERVPGSNLISSLSGAAGARGRSVFLLGGDPGTAEGAARALKQKYPGVIVAGTHFPPFGFQNSPKEMSAIIQVLSEAKPDIVFVALGSPKQEKLIARLRPILPAAWWIGVGNSFSFLAGHVKRAPLWMQRIGMEWLHRLMQEPRRLFKRYLIVGIPYATSLLGRSALYGIPNRLRRLRSGRQPAPASLLPGPAPTRGSSEGLIAAEEALAARLSAAPAAQEPEPPAILPISPEIRQHGLTRLRAIVLLGGSVRASALVSATSRSVLDLPLDEKGTILNHWLRHADEIARWAALERLPVRVMVNQTAMEPRSAEVRHYGSFCVERDLSDYRGTGGVLHDVAADYDDDDLILVANAAQVLLDPLPALAAALHRKGGDVAVVSHDDGTPSGIMLLACKALRPVAASGFVDMKEQALPLIASKYDVRVLHRRRPTGLPIRSLSDYIQALRLHHLRKSGRPGPLDPLAEDWSPTFSLIEQGAVVDASARVHDATVLCGARVDAGAVVVRSVICAGAVVGRDRTAVDQLVVATSVGGRRRQAADTLLAGV